MAMAMTLRDKSKRYHFFCLLLGAAFGAGFSFPPVAKAEVSEVSTPLGDARKIELTYIVKQDCGSCHGMLLKGGLGPDLLPRKFENSDADGIAALIFHGLPGTPMPPWKGILSQQETKWIAKQLKSGAFIHEN